MPDFDSKGPRPCATNPELFFSEVNFPPKSQEALDLVAAAKKVCATCPYKKECAVYALDNPDERGVWGGLSEADRKAFRKTMAGGKVRRARSSTAVRAPMK